MRKDDFGHPVNVVNLIEVASKRLLSTLASEVAKPPKGIEPSTFRFLYFTRFRDQQIGYNFRQALSFGSVSSFLLKLFPEKAYVGCSAD